MKDEDGIWVSIILLSPFDLCKYRFRCQQVVGCHVVIPNGRISDLSFSPLGTVPKG